MYEFLKNENLKNPNVRHNLLAMDKQSKEFDEEYKNAGGFIFLLCPRTQRTLLGLRGPNADFEPDTWNPLGGTMEPNECPLLSAMRETYEEGKILPNQYKLDPNIFHLDLNEDENGITHRVYIYLGTVESEIDPTIDHEHTDARWMHINDLPKVPLFLPLKRALMNASAIQMIKNEIMNKGTFNN